jgi:hypothetical protein
MLVTIRRRDAGVGIERLMQTLGQEEIGKLQAEIVGVGAAIGRDVQMQIVMELDGLRRANLFPWRALAGSDIYDPPASKFLGCAGVSRRKTDCPRASQPEYIANAQEI